MSKIIEVSPIDLKMAVEEMCFKRFTVAQFQEKERQIVDVLLCDLNTTHSLEFILLYGKMIKFFVQERF
jgi:hypothetical protein